MESPVVAWNREHLSYETDPQNDNHNQLRAFMWNNSTPWEKPLKNLFIMQKSGVSHSMTARLDLGTPLKIHFQEFEAPLGNRNRAEESWAVSYLAPTDSRHRQTQHNLNFAETPHCQHEKTLLRNPTAFSSSCNTGRIAFHGRGDVSQHMLCLWFQHQQQPGIQISHLSHLKRQISHLAWFW